MTALLPFDSVLPICISERPVVAADELPLIPIDEQPVMAIKNTAAKIVFTLYAFFDLFSVEILLRSDGILLPHGLVRCRKSIEDRSAVRQQTTSNERLTVPRCQAV